MDWDIIIVAVLGLLGTISSAYLTNRMNIKNQERIIKLEIDKQNISNEAEYKKLKLQKQIEIQQELINSEIDKKSKIFADYSYYASLLRYTQEFYRPTHHNYLNAYNLVCQNTENSSILLDIHRIHDYLNKNRTDSLYYDEKFEQLLDKLNEKVVIEIRLNKSQLKNIDTQE